MSLIFELILKGELLKRITIEAAVIIYTLVYGEPFSGFDFSKGLATVRTEEGDGRWKLLLSGKP